MSKRISATKATASFILSLLDESEDEVRALGIDPQDLADIYNDYLTRQDELDDIGAFISRTLSRATGVYSVKYRVKEPDHLLKKIIRKKGEYPERHTTAGNYTELINDLVGIRVLHLYKETWQEIGDYIQSKWDLKRAPYAYVKATGKEKPADMYANYGCEVLAHPSGYQAVHFVIETKPDKQSYYAEVQLRTLFEEGWSEIDHNIRYPDHDNSELLDCMLTLLNKFTTRADEMTSAMLKIAQTVQKYKKQGNLNNAAAELRAFADKLPLENDEKKWLHMCIARIVKNN